MAFAGRSPPALAAPIPGVMGRQTGDQVAGMGVFERAWQAADAAIDRLNPASDTYLQDVALEIANNRPTHPAARQQYSELESAVMDAAWNAWVPKDAYLKMMMGQGDGTGGLGIRSTQNEGLPNQGADSPSDLGQAQSTFPLGGHGAPFQVGPQEQAIQEARQIAEPTPAAPPNPLAHALAYQSATDPAKYAESIIGMQPEPVAPSWQATDDPNVFYNRTSPNMQTATVPGIRNYETVNNQIVDLNNGEMVGDFRDIENTGSPETGIAFTHPSKAGVLAYQNPLVRTNMLGKGAFDDPYAASKFGNPNPVPLGPGKVGMQNTVLPDGRVLQGPTDVPLGPNTPVQGAEIMRQEAQDPALHGGQEVQSLVPTGERAPGIFDTREIAEGFPEGNPKTREGSFVKRAESDAIKQRLGYVSEVTAMRELIKSVLRGDTDADQHRTTLKRVIANTLPKIVGPAELRSHAPENLREHFDEQTGTLPQRVIDQFAEWITGAKTENWLEKTDALLLDMGKILSKAETPIHRDALGHIDTVGRGIPTWDEYIAAGGVNRPLMSQAYFVNEILAPYNGGPGADAGGAQTPDASLQDVLNQAIQRSQELQQQGAAPAAQPPALPPVQQNAPPQPQAPPPAALPPVGPPAYGGARPPTPPSGAALQQGLGHSMQAPALLPPAPPPSNALLDALNYAPERPEASTRDTLDAAILNNWLQHQMPNPNRPATLAIHPFTSIY